MRVRARPAAEGEASRLRWRSFVMSFTEFSQLERAFGFGYENHTLWLRSVVSAGSGDRNHEMPVHTRDPLDPRASHWNWLSYYIRWLREKNGLSLAQCGKVLGVTRGTVCNFESGYRRLDEHYAVVVIEGDHEDSSGS
jgi:hypothetical protein